MARSPRNYPYNLRTGDLKDSAYNSLIELAYEYGADLRYPEYRDDYFDRARDLYPDISDDDLWDVWRDWYHGTAT